MKNYYLRLSKEDKENFLPFLVFGFINILVVIIFIIMANSVIAGVFVDDPKMLIGIPETLSAIILFCASYLFGFLWYSKKHFPLIAFGILFWISGCLRTLYLLFYK